MRCELEWGVPRPVAVGAGPGSAPTVRVVTLVLVG